MVIFLSFQEYCILEEIKPVIGARGIHYIKVKVGRDVSI